MSNQQQLMEKMVDIYAKVVMMSSNRKEGESSQSRNNKRPKGSSHTSHYHSYTPHLVKLEFPRFNEVEDPTNWICRAEQFFRFHETSATDQVELASFHLEGRHNCGINYCNKRQRQLIGKPSRRGY